VTADGEGAHDPGIVAGTDYTPSRCASRVHGRRIHRFHRFFGTRCHAVALALRVPRGAGA
jgi:hypothetical protein